MKYIKYNTNELNTLLQLNCICELLNINRFQYLNVCNIHYINKVGVVYFTEIELEWSLSGVHNFNLPYSIGIYCMYLSKY